MCTFNPRWKHGREAAVDFTLPAFLASKVQNPLGDQLARAGSHLHRAEGQLAWPRRQPAAAGRSTLQLIATLIATTL